MPTSPYPARLRQLRSLFDTHKIDGWLVPSTDAFQNEYVPLCYRRLAWLTGFDGSNGIAVVLRKKAAFFTDGRYMLQAKTQVPSLYTTYNLTDKKPWEWAAASLDKKHTLGYDPRLHTRNTLAPYEKQGYQLKAIEDNLIDIIWQGNRPSLPDSPLFLHPDTANGHKARDKIGQVAGTLKKAGYDAVLITAPDSVCWLLNIRGEDVPYTPLALASALVEKNGHTTLILDNPARVTPAIAKVLGRHVKVQAAQAFFTQRKWQGVTVQMDPANSGIWWQQQLHAQGAMVVYGQDPCQLPKACKNAVELEAIRKAHLIDGVAVTRFLYWLQQAVEKGGILTEMGIADTLLHFRQQGEGFCYPSFATIAGFAAHAAIVHYQATEASNATIKGNGLLLVDSGGQYRFGGTTDITRTIAIGKPTEAQKTHYTLVLKGHIALATALFPEGTTGSQLDSLARQYLWQQGLDYDHGTGHGVGSFLSVHEGPQRISKHPNTTALRPGMVVSNEPGYYLEGSHGIRIENLQVVEQAKQDGDWGGSGVCRRSRFKPAPAQNSERAPAIGHGMLCFAPLTLVPLDPALIAQQLLTDVEKNWLADYHAKVFKALSPYLPGKEKQWLKVRNSEQEQY